MPSERDQAVLDLAEKFLVEEVKPNAGAIDTDQGALGLALQGLCARNLMALKRPKEFGGPALEEPAFRTFQESVARYSGSLAFLQTQHQSAVSMIVRGSNEALKKDCLPLMADGTKLVGIGFSQLRRPGPPLMVAEPMSEGYVLRGSVPWITGLGFFPEFLVGAQLPDGSSLFAVIPLANVDSQDARITVSEPMRLAAMETAQTVSAEVRHWKISQDHVVDIKPPGWIHSSDQINIVLQAYFALGGARAGLDIVLQAYEKKGHAFLKDCWDRLDAEILACRNAMEEAQRLSGEATTDEKLKLRAWAIDLAVRCAHAGVAASSGAANDVRHPAQRVFREALVYTVSAQTLPIMEATVERLSRASS